MKHPFFESAAPLVFAHRGGAALGPENTMAAFRQGAALGADGLELDVRLSRDGIVVVHHDPTLDRTTNVRGPVARFTADELATADAGWHFVRADTRPFRGHGIGVPTLAEVVDAFPHLRIIVELKENTPQLARAVVDVVREAHAIDRVCLGSFGRRVLRAARAFDPRVATTAAREEVRWALYRSWIGWSTRRVGYDGYQVPEWSGTTRVVSRRFVDVAHRAGLAVQVWTVNKEADARRLLSWGVDALITDRPDIMVALLRDGAGQV